MDDVVTCSLCGHRPQSQSDGGTDVAPLGWSADIVETSAGPATRWVCPDCTRRYVRSIESKLDREWW